MGNIQVASGLELSVISGFLQSAPQLVVPAPEPISADSTLEMEWVDRLDRLDPFFASKADLGQMLSTAPSKAHRDWLSQRIAENQAFEQRLFDGGSDIPCGRCA